MRLLIDTSVLIKWFHDVGESDVAEARAIRDAHVRSELDAHVLDLAIYEVGNVLTRALKWTARDVGARRNAKLFRANSVALMHKDIRIRCGGAPPEIYKSKILP